MHRITRRTALLVVVIGALAAGGAAFTASNTVPNTTAGYGSSTISGATATDIKYTLNGDGTEITAAAITFQGDVSSDNVEAGFETSDLTTCTVGSFNSGTSSTVATCSGYTEPTSSSASFNVAVTNN